MKSIFSQKLVLVLFIFLLAVSCKDEDLCSDVSCPSGQGCNNGICSPNSGVNTSIVGAWYMISAIEDGVEYINDTSEFALCDLDDEYVFNSNGTYELNEGLTKCDPSDPQVYENGTYTLNAGTLVWTYTVSGVTDSWELHNVAVNGDTMTADNSGYTSIPEEIEYYVYLRK